jgi:hypothetical protein
LPGIYLESVYEGTSAAAEASAIRVKGNRLYIGNRPAVTPDEGLDPKIRLYPEGVIVEAGKALAAGEVLYTTRLYDRDELRRFERAAEKLKRELQGTYKPKSNFMG